MDRSKEIKSRVKGFIEPVFVSADGLNGLAPGDFELVRQGYACANCLAIFDTYTITCPVCGLSRDVEADIMQAPELWQQHVNERNQEQPTSREKLNPLELIMGISNDPEVEQISLSKLRRKR